jgi:PTH1 family peptidyl-tRNA hydrolase
MSGIKLLVGLGNPGEKYTHTRHNAGFWWVDLISQQTNSALAPDSKLFSITGKLNPHSDRWLAKPTTFMNASGKAIAAIARYYKIQPDEILVIHDELDLPAGSAKLKFGGGHGGHNGLRDTHAALGTPDYWRLRVGIGHPGERSEVVNFVLKPPSKDEQRLIEDALYESSKVLVLLLAGDMEQAMLKLHTKT